MPKTNPESLEEVNSLEVTPELKTFVSDLASDVQQERVNRKWWDLKIDRYRALRYGIRAPRNKPWPRAANYSIPLIDSDINRIKPSYVNLAYAVTPVVLYEPYGAEDVEPARLREQLFDWRLRTKIGFFKPYVLGVDRLLEQGQVIFKIVWNFTTRSYTENFDVADFPEEVQAVLYDAGTTDEMLAKIIEEEFDVDTEHEENVEEIDRAVQEFRDGASEFDLEFVETENNQPEVIACDLREDLVIPVDTIDLNDARFIDYVYPESVNDVKIAMQEGTFIEYSDADIEEWSGNQPAEKKNLLPSQYQDDVIWLHEVCCWYDVNDDGILERCIATYPHDNPDVVLRFIELPYDHGKWPYVQVRREWNDDGFYTPRGIPELDEDFQRGISTFMNQTVDAGTIMNNPQVVFKRNALSNPKNRRYVPGEEVEVNTNLQDYEIRQSGNVAQNLNLQLSQFLKSWSDQRLGNVTGGISDEAGLPGAGRGGKKTAKEISLIQSLQGQTQSLDLQIFQDQMAEVYYQIDALYEQWGDEEEEFLINGSVQEKSSRAKIQGRYDMVPNGRLDNSNVGIRLQKSVSAMQFFLDDPFVKQRELREVVANDLDPRIAKRIMKSDEEVQQEQLQQQQLIEAAKIKAIQEGLVLKEAENIVEEKHQMRLAPIQGKKYAPD